MKILLYLIFIINISPPLFSNNLVVEKKIPLFKHSISALSISPDGKYLAAGSEEGRLILYHRGNSALVAIGNHAKKITDIAWLNNQQVVTSSLDCHVKLWDIHSKKVRINREHTSPIFTVAADPKGKWVASGDLKGNLILWNPLNNEIKISSHHKGPIWSLQFGLQGNFVVSAGGEGDNTIILWKPSTDQKIIMRHHNRGINSVKISPHGLLIASGSSDNSLKIFSLRNRKEIVKLYDGENPIWQIQFHPKKSMILFTEKKERLMGIEIKTSKKITLFKHKVMIHQFIVFKNYYYIGDSQGNLIILKSKEDIS